MFWSAFVDLCAKRGVSPNAVAKELTLSSGSVTSWKGGAIPRPTTIKRIADYFGVSPDLFLEKTDEPGIKEAPATEGEGYTEVQKAAIQFVLSLPPEKLERFIKMGRAAFEEGQ